MERHDVGGGGQKMRKKVNVEDERQQELKSCSLQIRTDKQIKSA